MSTPVKNEDVEQSLRSALAAEGFTMNPKLGYGETGVDILATRHDEQYYIHRGHWDIRNRHRLGRRIFTSHFSEPFPVLTRA